MVNSGEMRCGKVTFTWDYDTTFKKVVSPDENKFLSVPVLIRPVKCIGHNPLIVIDGEELNGVYVVTPGNEAITAWDSKTSKLFNCKFGHSCRKNYCAFVDCKAHRKTAQIITELNKLNDDGYPRDLEIRIYSDYECEYYDNAVVSRNHDIEMITKMIKQHANESKLKAVQVAVHRQTVRYTQKPNLPPKQQPQKQSKQQPQTFKIDEVSAYRRNIREALSKLKDIVESINSRVETDRESDNECENECQDEHNSQVSNHTFMNNILGNITEVVDILNGDKFKNEEIEKIRKDYEAFLDSQNKLFEEKINAVIRRNEDLAKKIVEPQQNQEPEKNLDKLPLPPPPSSSTTTNKKWSEIVDEN